MTINGLEFDAAVLCGGRSARMGQNKALLSIGSESFAGAVSSELASFGRVFVSCAPDSPEYALPGTERVNDVFPDCGPAAGIHAVLEASHADAVLFVPCDVPLFTAEAGKYLCSKLTEDYDAVVITDSGGRLHPLTAVYRKSCAEVFADSLKNGNRRVRTVLEKLRVLEVPSGELPGGEAALANVNTPEDYRALIEKLRNEKD